jgi:hypothetical protein
VIEAADPARTMPKWLVLSAVIAVILLVIVMSLLNRRSLEQPSNPPAAVASAPATKPAQQRPAPPPAAAAQGPVVLTATAPAWVRITDQGKTLFEGMMQPGQTYQVPPTAVAPMIRAGAPEALRINVGNAVAPPIGPAGQVTNASLKGADLMRGGAQAGAPAPAAANAISQ